MPRLRSAQVYRYKKRNRLERVGFFYAQILKAVFIGYYFLQIIYKKMDFKPPNLLCLLSVWLIVIY
jgi:hypothetical protein